MEILNALSRFAPVFSKQVWESALWLLIGAILAPGKRTVRAVLRVLGLSEDPHYQSYHRVLIGLRPAAGVRAVWSSLAASGILLQWLINEWSAWLSLMLLVPIPWAQRVWALPFLTVLAPSERYSQRYRQRHKRLTDWARQLLRQVRRWQPSRSVV